MQTFKPDEAIEWFTKYQATLTTGQQHQAERQLQLALDTMEDARKAKFSTSSQPQSILTKYTELIDYVIGF